MYSDMIATMSEKLIDSAISIKCHIGLEFVSCHYVSTMGQGLSTMQTNYFLQSVKQSLFEYRMM